MQIFQSLAAVAFLASSVLTSPVAAPAPAPGFLDPVADTSAGGIDKRSFLATCTDPWVGFIRPDGAPWPGTFHLKARCRNQSGGWNDSLLNLDKCLVNENGRVSWRKYGNLSPSCTGFQRAEIVDSQYQVMFNCQDPNGWGQYTTLNLNAKIHNSNGNLRCDV